MTRSPPDKAFLEKIASTISEAIDAAHWLTGLSYQERAALFDVLPAEDIRFLGLYASEDIHQVDPITGGRIVWTAENGRRLSFDFKTKVWRCSSIRGYGVVAGLTVLVDDSLANVVDRLCSVLGQSLLKIHRDCRFDEEAPAS
jgi:hypothetical protein